MVANGFRAGSAAWFVVLAVISMLSSARFAPGSVVSTVEVDASKRFQTIEGFGTGLASLTPTWSHDFQKMYARDLGASVVRMEFRPDVLPEGAKLGPDIQSNIRLMNFDRPEEKRWGDFAAQMNADRMDQMKVIATVLS